MAGSPSANIIPFWKSPLDAALFYARQGMKIFPCHYVKVDDEGQALSEEDWKKPPLAGWPLGATTDEDQVKRWWTRWPDALIGHRPGDSGCVVFDIDMKRGKDGESEWKGLGFKNFRTMESTTRNGGSHVWALKADFHVGNYRLRPSIDVRGDDGYVILPSFENGYHWARWGAPSAMPPELAELLRSVQKDRAAAEGASSDGWKVTGALKRWRGRIERRWRSAKKKKAWISYLTMTEQDLIPKLDEGNRSDIVWAMEKDFCEMGVPQGDAFELIWPMAVCKWRGRRDGERDLRIEIDKAYTEYQAEHAEIKTTPHPQLLSSFAAVVSKFLWYPDLPEGEGVVFAGPGGVGKGVAAADLGARVTKGRRWPLSKERAKAGNVLWMEQEDSIGKTVRPRLEASGADLDKVIIVNAKQFKEWVNRQYIIDNDIRLIVLSPLLSAMDLRDNINEVTVRDRLESMAELWRDLPTTMLGLMHVNKKGDQTAIQRISGTVAFANFNRGALTIAREKPVKGDPEPHLNRFRIIHQKHNLTPWGAQNDLIGDIYNTRQEEDPRGQYLAVEWSEAEKNIDPDNAFDSKRGKKDEDDQTIVEWLTEYLAVNGPTPVEIVREAALTRNYNWGSVTAKRGKHPEIFATEPTKTFPKSQIWRLV
jgi:Bifunctional DNA primase/polymerase, N-terminal/AAA domain